jgi:hypothetical protein
LGAEFAKFVRSPEPIQTIVEGDIAGSFDRRGDGFLMAAVATF